MRGKMSAKHLAIELISIKIFFWLGMVSEKKMNN